MSRSASAPVHVHHAFGLVVRSSWPLPELPPGPVDAAGDVEIVAGPVPERLDDATVSNAFFDVARERMLVRIPGVARYLLEQGRRVVIAAEPDAAEDEVRAFLGTVIFGALLHQREDLVLHGSAVEIGGRAVAFLGFSGLGKSTLAAGFRQRGHAVLTDDLCVVRPRAAGGWEVVPSFPHMKLWLDSLEQLGLSADGLRRIRSKEAKRALPVVENFATTARPLAKLYVLRRSDTVAQAKLMPLDSSARLAALGNQAYRPGMLAGLSGHARHFEQAVVIARALPMSLLVRPPEGFHLEAMIDLVLADLAAPGT